ncbi:uncharacterized protein K452DRAFT_296990 [Aplosporella prunicola CBS 121167]|uniref:Uncharacterized protein n=1 Tax=Aplosporella prunicola CBS 121167 TaxID=1176127 RepID=A0A6A6BIG3_9PEZI|nr:uncharacterized protein K452DRAFT_296990 [Aplosporella prunicola CBS 121167]KAF2143213.1 hypothetical protein K452DRAFT_296990 [Aplosporella prunicola CBS 121167]
MGSFGHNFLDRVQELYSSEGSRRWNRLCRENHWVFLDQFFLFTRWSQVLNVVADNLASTEVVAYQKTLPITPLARALHMDIASTIELREHIRFHKDVIRQIKSCVTSAAERKRGSGYVVDDLFMQRLKGLFHVLEHYERLIETTREQLQNLLSLVFNAETVEQGKLVSRLTALAFVFIPLSLVAVSFLTGIFKNIERANEYFELKTVFGMTEAHISPKWYAASAAPVLILTIAAASILPPIFDAWDNYRVRFTRTNSTAIEGASQSEQAQARAAKEQLTRATTFELEKHRRRQSLSSQTHLPSKSVQNLAGARLFGGPVQENAASAKSARYSGATMNAAPVFRGASEVEKRMRDTRGRRRLDYDSPSWYQV